MFDQNSNTFADLLEIPESFVFGGYFMVVNEMVLDLFKANGKIVL